MKKYDPKKIEPKWQKYWAKQKTFEVAENTQSPAGIPSGEKFYGLIEFPYPSGEGLHVGHPRPFTAMDVITRKKRMEGKNVLFPIGFDAFGLPTENFAIKTGKPPAEVTKKNIANFTRQLKMLGFGFDWSRQVDTTDPNYYKWTQWLFLQFYKHGLAYKKNQPINWCPKDKIGLANEEVVGGCCERCGTAVEKRNKEQWMLGITKYADKLLEGLKDVNYIERARVQQENWIGKSEGAEVVFPLRVPGQADGAYSVTVFTTRPDTIFGVTFLAISPELAKSWLDAGWKPSAEVVQYIDQELKNRAAITTREEQEKTGVRTDVLAVNPVSKESVSVWVTNYVMGGVGTGALMGVPAHDERDFDFAKKFGLPIKQVVAPYIVQTGDGAPRSDQNIIEFRAATTIIKHWDKELFYVVNFSEALQGFVGGHVESGEAVLDTASREVTEESGYTDIKSIKPLLEHAYGRGYKVRKSREEICHDSVFVAQLGSNARREIIDAETVKGGWMSAEEILKLPTFATSHKVFFEHYIKNKPFTETGRIVNSGEFDGLVSDEAKEKIVAWLEKNKIGKKQTNYKLRDWVFSRQRYWGEPIPLVYCEHCKNKKQKVLLIHGFRSSGVTTGALQKQLEAQGFEVMAPVMSTKDEPVFEKWMEELKQYVEQLGENDIVIGHSLGGHAALSVLAKNKKRIGSLYLIAPAFGKYSEQYWDIRKKDHPDHEDSVELLRLFIETPIDIELVSSLVKNKTVVWSADDEKVPEPSRSIYPSDWYLYKTNGFGHFNQYTGSFLSEIIVSAKNTGWVPLPESELPLKLPKVEQYQPTDTGESPLAAMEKWVKTKCPNCGGAARRETDTMPNWAGSSWYFLAYALGGEKRLAEQNFWNQELLKQWMPVDWYNGGMEHTVLHLLYSRFWNQFLYDVGFVPTSEPYKKRTSHGMILAKGGEKMSKSRGNVVNPDEMVGQFGADALRTYIMFMGPFDQAVEWDTNGLVGVRRFLEKVWGLQEKTSGAAASDAKTQMYLHQTIKKVTEDIDDMRFNTAIAKMMELANEMSKQEKIAASDYALFVKILSPFAPHLCEEIWNQLGNSGSIALEVWPEYNEALTKEQEITLAVQINGKLRDAISVDAEITEAAAKEIVLASPAVQKWLEGKEPKKIIYVKGKLISIVV